MSGDAFVIPIPKHSRREQLRAQRQAGGLLAATDAIGRGKKSLTLRDLDVDHNQSHRWQRIAAMHGLRRTNADKRRAVETLLRDEEWAKWSNCEIARRCFVSEAFVRSLRTKRSDEESVERTYTTKHGTQATMQIASIGHHEILSQPAPAIQSSAADETELDEPEADDESAANEVGQPEANNPASEPAAYENTCREPLKPSELVALGKAIEAIEKPKAEERKAHGSTAPGKPMDAAGKLPEALKGDTRDKVAAALGVSGRTYEKAKAVVAAAEQRKRPAHRVRYWRTTGRCA